MTPPPPPSLSAARILTILGLFAGLGWLIGVVTAYLLPLVFEARTLVADEDRNGQTMQVAPGHAAIVVCELDLPHRWGCDWDTAVRRVRERSRLRNAPEGTWIEVEASSSVDAQSLAKALADHFYGMEAEIDWCGVPDPGPPTDRELETLVKARMLIRLIGQALDQKGVPVADQSSAVARRLASTHEDVGRQLAMLDTMKGDCPLLPPHDPLLRRAQVRVPAIAADVPVSPNHEAIIQGSLWGGIVVGLLTLVALARWKPGKLRARPPKAAPAPAWAAEKTAARDAEEW